MLNKHFVAMNQLNGKDASIFHKKSLHENYHVCLKCEHKYKDILYIYFI